MPYTLNIIRNNWCYTISWWNENFLDITYLICSSLFSVLSAEAAALGPEGGGFGADNLLEVAVRVSDKKTYF